MSARHPRGLTVLFFTEMWERFGFYLMTALFVLYLDEKLGWGQERAMGFNAWYKFFAYMSPMLGGYLADRHLGYRRAVWYGSLLLAAGYFVMSGVLVHSLMLAMCLLVVGNGLFKPNISTLVGNLYAAGDSRRDSAFSIFYMGINSGAFGGPLVGEALRSAFGWEVAFAAAGVAMLLSNLIFWVFRDHLAVADQRSSVGAILDVPIEDPRYADCPDPPEVERKRIVALLVMCGIVMIFWMAFQQNENTMPLWARDCTDRVIPMVDFRELIHLRWRVVRWEIPPGVFNSVNPGFIIVLTPPVVLLLHWLTRRGFVLTTPAKIGLGMFLTAASYVIMAVAAALGGNTGRVSLWWLVANYCVITIAEIFLSPMGLSMVTKLAPRRMTAMLMGVWFLATAFGNWLAGKTGSWFWKLWSHSSFFLMLVGASTLAGLVLLTQYRRLQDAIPPEPEPESKAVEATPEPEPKPETD